MKRFVRKFCAFLFRNTTKPAHTKLNPGQTSLFTCDEGNAKEQNLLFAFISTMKFNVRPGPNNTYHKRVNLRHVHPRDS